MCGIDGCYKTPYAPELTKLGLYMQQHRGQEWVGILSSDGNNFYPERYPFRAEGLVEDVLTNEVMRTMMGHMAMGHVRYSTQGESELNNAQPCRGQGDEFFCSNGDIINCHTLRQELMHQGVTFNGQVDAEVIIKLISNYHRETHDWVTAIQRAKKRLNGSFSGCLMTKDKMFLIRDHLENRPFCYTVCPSDNAVFFASESAALDIMTADYPGFDRGRYELHEVSGNEIIELSNGRLTIHPDPAPAATKAHCIFEMIYFSRPDSIVFEQSVKEFRQRLARVLVSEAYPEGDVVVPVPDSSNDAALEISYTTGIRFEFLLYRHHYTGRTFIAPSQTLRDYGVKKKFNPDRRGIAGKRIILIDDSIVRSTTIRKLVSIFKRYGATQITALITCPLIVNRCYYGIDMKENLIADIKRGDVQAIKAEIGLEARDRLHFTSLHGLKTCVPDPQNWCFGCLGDGYPTDVSEYVPPE